MLARVSLLFNSNNNWLRDSEMSDKWIVCVIGLGTVGMPTAEYIASKNIEVYGYDIVPKKCKNFPATTIWEKVPHEEINVYVITVWVGLKENKPDLTSLYDVCEKISKVNRKALVAIESTIPVGTCRKLSEKYGLQRIVHVPHRLSLIHI